MQICGRIQTRSQLRETRDGRPSSFHKHTYSHFHTPRKEKERLFLGWDSNPGLVCERHICFNHCTTEDSTVVNITSHTIIFGAPHRRQRARHVHLSCKHACTLSVCAMCCCDARSVRSRSSELWPRIPTPLLSPGMINWVAYHLLIWHRRFVECSRPAAT